MIEIKQGNLLTEPAQALVNTVNCVGVMGKGIALQFKQAYPENFRQYEKACRAGQLQPGEVFTVATGNLFNLFFVLFTESGNRTYDSLIFFDYGNAVS